MILSDSKPGPVVVEVNPPQCGHTTRRTHFDVVSPQMEIHRSFIPWPAWCEDGVVTVALEVVLHVVEGDVVRVAPNLAVPES